MTQKTNPVVVTARRAVVAAALAGGTCWHTTVLAQSEEGHTISPIRLQVGDWVLVATLNDEEQINGFVAIQPDPIDANAIDHVWFEFQEDGLTKSYAEELNAGEAIRAIKAELGISDDQDELWPVAVAPDPSPPVFVKKPMGRGVSKLDPMNELLKTLPPTAAKATLDDLEEVGWRAANLDVFASECSDEEILGLIGVNLAVGHAYGEVEEQLIDLSSISDECPRLRELALMRDSLPSRPEIQIVNTGDPERFDPYGNSYFRIGDKPVFLAIAEDADGEELPATMTWDDESQYVPGTPLSRSGMLCLSTTATDAMDRTTTEHQYLQVHPFEYTEVTVNGSYTLSSDGAGGSEMTAEIQVTPLYVDADQINAGVVYMEVQYPNASRPEGYSIETLWIDGMYDGPDFSLSPESAVAHIQDNTLVATLRGSIPSETIIGARLVGHGIGYPDSFIFEDYPMLEQREDDGGGDEGDGLDNDDFPGGTVTVDSNHPRCWAEDRIKGVSWGFEAHEVDFSFHGCKNGGHCAGLLEEDYSPCKMFSGGVWNCTHPADECFYTRDHWARYKNHTDGVNLLGNEAFAKSSSFLIEVETQQNGGQDDQSSWEDQFGEEWLLSYKCTDGTRPCNAKWVVTPNIRGMVTADIDVNWALRKFQGLIGSAGAAAQSALIGRFWPEGGIPEEKMAAASVRWTCLQNISLSWYPGFTWTAPDPMQTFDPEHAYLDIETPQEVDAGSPNDEDVDGDGVGDGNTTFVKMIFNNWLGAGAASTCPPAAHLISIVDPWVDDEELPWWYPVYFTEATADTTSLSATFTETLHVQFDCNGGAYHPPMH